MQCPTLLNFDPGVASRELLLEFWDSLFISGKVAAIDFKLFSTSIDP